MTGNASSAWVPPVGRRSDEAIIAPDGSEVRLLLTDEHGATRCSAVEVTIGAGETSRTVAHRTVEEIWYVLSGTGEVWRCPPGAPATEVPPVQVAASDALVIPTGWQFQFRADADSDLRFVCVTMPAWPGLEEAVNLPPGGLGAATLAPPDVSPGVEPR
jgi:mannose-6-phosphate isomerase-like protein (cupin superfamily)